MAVKPKLAGTPWQCLLVAALMVILTACADNRSAETGDGVHSDPTGTLAFSLAWKHPVRSAEGTRTALSPSGDVCLDYNVDEIVATVLGSQRNALVTETWPCADHTGTFSSVPVGEMLILSLDGLSGGEVSWHSEVTGISIAEGQTTNLGQVTMLYVGSDAEPPQITATSPAGGATGVPIDTVISVTFSEPLVPASVNDQTFRVTAGGVPLTGQVAYASASNSATFTPDTVLLYRTTYEVSISTGIEDLSGQPLIAPVSWIFTTAGGDDMFQLTATTTAGGRIEPPGVQTVAAGASQTFAMTPDDGYYLSELLVDGVAIPAVAQYTFDDIRADHSIHAVFALAPLVVYTINATSTTGGVIAPQGVIVVAAGDRQTFTITPDEGSATADVIVDGISQGARDRFEFVDVTSDHVIHAVFQTVWFVDGRTSSPGDGKSWETAFNSIQRAVDAAHGGDEIWVREGTYRLDTQIGIDQTVLLLGGFNGDESFRDQRDWRRNETVIDGGDRVRCFYLSAGAVIDGFTIENGYNGVDGGGAVFNDRTDATIQNCHFFSNRADGNAGAGGAIYNAGGSPLIVNSIFVENSAHAADGGQGGAILNDNSDARILNCTFSENQVSGNILLGWGWGAGAAIANWGPAAPEIKNSIVWNNLSTDASLFRQPERPSGISGEATVSYSDVDQPDYTGTNQNIMEDPLLDKNYHLKSRSPCIDTGDDIDEVGTDIDGDPRIVGPAIDMGADEFVR